MTFALVAFWLLVVGLLYGFSFITVALITHGDDVSLAERALLAVGLVGVFLVASALLLGVSWGLAYLGELAYS